MLSCKYTHNNAVHTQIIGGHKTIQHPNTQWEYKMHNGFLEGNYRIFRLINAPKF